MKKIIIGSFGLLACLATQAQVLYNNGATVTISNGCIVTVNGSATNVAGSTITNNGAFNVSGNITNNATITAAAGSTLTLNGTTAQTLGGTTAMVAKNVVVNNAAGITLATPLSIDGAATFTNGVINATDISKPLVFTANGSISSTPTNASHVNGYVTKEGTGAFTYPVGNATNYQPVGINLTANSGGLRAMYVVGDAGAASYGNAGTDHTPLLQYNKNEYWDLTPVGTATGSVTIYYDSYQVTPISTNTADQRVAHKSGGQWLNEGRATGSTGDNFAGAIISNPVSTWSPYTFGGTSAIILPLQWVNVTAAVKEETKAQVSWQVQEEKVKSYTLERSADSRNFTAVTTVASLGNGTHTYNYTDAAAFTSNKQAYYRLLQTNMDGAASYSKIVQVAITKGASISVYPTPFHTSFVVNSAVAQTGTLSDNAGRVVAKLQLKMGSNTVQGQTWATGTYYLTTASGEVYKLVKD